MKNSNLNSDGDLEESENIIWMAIFNYFKFRWSRNFSEDKEIEYAARVRSLIRTALKMGTLPTKFNIVYFVPSDIFIGKKTVPRSMVEGYFYAVGDYLAQKLNRPYDLRMLEHQEKIHNAH